MRRVFVACALALGSSACVAFPFALPPTQLEIGSGYRNSGKGEDAPLSLRAALSPLGLDKSMLDRPVDVNAGVLYEAGKTRTIEGAFLEGGGFIGHSRLSPESIARASLRMQVRLLTAEDTHVLGRGAAIRMVGELCGFTDGAFGATDKSGGAFGYAYGEGAFGGYLEGSYAEINGTNIWQASAGLSIRLPLVAGIIWAWGLPKFK